MSALAEANRIRLAQAAELRKIRAGGYAEAVALLTDPDEIQGAIKLEKVLLSVPRYGRHRVSVLLNDCGIQQSRMLRRVRELTERERLCIASMLETYGKRVWKKDRQPVAA